ncbi:MULTISPECIES: TetR/AcrR family transcriptional regulator [unclassified Moraxella]|uniref:TetR/AcrR family transcriptional regulator n=1 Tax=unclassified Moraxella TaxID=2685852 RepID=UPI002B400C67|nr:MULTISPECIES: TetR/AcrR family transcriptional regulator [unclassified Moraxella]
MEHQSFELFDTTKPKRKNNPELLRHNILIAAKKLMLADGIANLSMQKVADLAETSKGGLFHHFKNKDTLIESVFELFIAQVNTAILQDIERLGEQTGVFTRAYVNVFFTNENIGLSSDWAGLIRAMNAESKLIGLWESWLSNKLKNYAHTDNDFRLSSIRCAVDGAWLNDIQAEYLPKIQSYLLGLIDEVKEK